MKEKLLKVIPFVLVFSIFLSIFDYFNIHITNTVDIIISSFCSLSFSICISLLVFCCLSRKSEELSNIGVFLVFLYLILSCVLLFMSLHFIGIKAIFIIKNVCTTLHYFIEFFRYVGILCLIDAFDEKSNKFRVFAVVCLLVFELFSVISVWKSFKIGSFVYNLREISYDLFRLCTVTFIVFRFFNSDVVDVSDSSSVQQSVNNNQLDSTAIQNNTIIDTNKVIASNSNIINNVSFVGVSSALPSSGINNVPNNIGQTNVTMQPSSSSQSNEGSLMSDFELVPNDKIVNNLNQNSSVSNSIGNSNNHIS